MNCKTRGQKIDEFLESAKRVLINTLLVIWAVLTAFLAIGFAGNKLENEELKGKIKSMEVQMQMKEETKTTETTYVVVDGHKYMVVDTAW